MDDLIDAFSKAEIDKNQNSSQDVIQKTSQDDQKPFSEVYEIQIKQEESNVVSNRDIHLIQNEIKTSNEVDVYIAPEVLGHRWVRSRSTAYIVERPERLRACLLGLSAVIGKNYDQCVNSKMDVDNSLSQDMNSLSILQSDRSSTIQTIISHAKISLDSPNEGLKAIHALEEEILSSEEIGEAPAYNIAKRTADQESKSLNESINDSHWPKAGDSYLSLLRTLCRMAPSKEPEAEVTVRSLRQHGSPAKMTEYNTGIKQEFETDSIPLQDGSFPSEIPSNLPQGDLYLCGEALLNKKYTNVVQPSQNEDPQQTNEPITPMNEFDAFVTDSGQHAPETPNKDQNSLDDKSTKVQIDFPSEAQLLSKGSQGAIEASLGACCAALDRIVMGANENDQNQTSQNERKIISVNLSDLHIPFSSSNSLNSTFKYSQPLKSKSRRAFVLARPPGHHCSATKPSGFCWVNNVAVMAAQAYEKYGIDRIAILDFDLHHGDGTQSIVWRINEQSVQKDANREARKNAILADEKAKEKKIKTGTSFHAKYNSDPLSVTQEESQIQQSYPSLTTTDEDRWTKLLGKRGLKMFYGSLHDIESFPCEDGDKQKVTDASVKIEGEHGQWIWNVHLASHSNREEFLFSYENKYKELIKKAQEFFEKTQSTPKSSLIIISAGFDACIHETPGMQRHGKNVPPEFYTIFTRDAVNLAEKMCKGKLISVLEGGYSDRALITGVISHLEGLTMNKLKDGFGEELCSLSVLNQIDRLSKIASSSMMSIKKDDEIVQDKLASEYVTSFNSSSILSNRKRSELSTKDPSWLKQTLETFKRLQEHCGNQRRFDLHGSSTAPATPKTDGISDSLWRSPRELRSSKISNSAKPSPSK